LGQTEGAARVDAALCDNGFRKLPREIRRGEAAMAREEFASGSIVGKFADLIENLFVYGRRARLVTGFLRSRSRH
jgi:hypothetical protein